MIRFFAEDISFTPSGQRALKSWIKGSLLTHEKELGEINFIFCSDSYLHQLNLEYLNHDTLTDIITFDQSDNEEIAGDIYISVDRVRDNARQGSVNFTDELHRVMIHGILHLIGYGDKTPKEKQLMRKKEDVFLSLRNNLE